MKRGPVITFLSRSLIFCGGVYFLWCVGFGLFLYDLYVHQIPPQKPLPKTDAIIVLTGGADRLDAGLSLLKRGLAKKLFLTGVHKSVRKKDLDVHESLPVDFGYQAETTIDNAYEARSWLSQEDVTTFYLVTAHYHMRRASLEFHQRLEARDLIPYPVIPHEFLDSSWWHHSSLAMLLLNEYNKYIVALGRAGARSLALTLNLIEAK